MDVERTVVHKVQPVTAVHTAPNEMGTGKLKAVWDLKLTTQFHPLPNLRMCGFIPPFTKRPPWRAQGSYNTFCFPFLPVFSFSIYNSYYVIFIILILIFNFTFTFYSLLLSPMLKLGGFSPMPINKLTKGLI